METVYDKIASEYARRNTGESYSWKFFRHLAKMERASTTVLDVGCGHGRDMLAMLRLGFAPTGVDVSRKLLSIARSSSLDVRYGDSRNLLFLDESFDNIWCNAVLHHMNVDSTRRSLDEFHRVLRSVGRAFLSVRIGMKEGYDNEYLGAPRYYNGMSHVEWETLMRSHHFEIEETECLENTKNGKSWLYLVLRKKNANPKVVTCPFCLEPEKSLQPNEKVLLANPAFKLLVDKCPVGKFHFLLVSSSHRLRFWDTSTQECEVARNSIQKFMKAINSTGYEAVSFEHGSSNDECIAGSSIVHAHIHVVAVSSANRFVREVRRFLALTQIDTSAETAIIGNEASYIWLVNNEQTSFLTFPEEKLPSQFLRKIVAYVNGTEESWDWKGSSNDFGSFSAHEQLIMNLT